PVEPLAKYVDVAGILPPLGSGGPAKAIPVGINDLDREPTLFEFGAKGPHVIVIGPPVTGKSTTLRSVALALAHLYPPEKVAMIFVDPSDASRRFFNFGGNGDNRLDRLPHVLATVTTGKELDEVIKRLKAEYDEQVIAKLQGQPGVFRAQDNQARSIFLIIDHYDDAPQVFNKSGAGLSGLAEVGKGKNLHLVIGGSMNIMRDSSDELRRRAESARYTLVMNDFEAVRYMGVRANFSISKELPSGRGFLIKAVSASMIQAAMPFVEGKNGLSAEEQLDISIGTIRTMYSQSAQWSYFAKDLAALDVAIKGEAAAAGEAEAQTESAPVPTSAEAGALMDDLAKLMAAQSSMVNSLTNIQYSDTPNFASVEIPEDGEQPDNGNRPEKAEKAETGKKKKK
ncbi:MAG TPA: FtsK/SpoIIIE domain-containing protein, partial [Anaerolineales bacterium]|nr:FtsK/SpoIIIE domain-containing protein [Anaerolineales bacterium]